MPQQKVTIIGVMITDDGPTLPIPEPPLGIWGPPGPWPTPPIVMPPGGGGTQPPQPPLGIWGPNDPRPTHPIQLPPWAGKPQPPTGGGGTPPTWPAEPPAFQPVGEPGPVAGYQWFYSPTYGWMLGVPPAGTTPPTEPPPVTPPTEPPPTEPPPAA